MDKPFWIWYTTIRKNDRFIIDESVARLQAEKDLRFFKYKQVNCRRLTWKDGVGFVIFTGPILSSTNLTGISVRSCDSFNFLISSLCYSIILSFSLFSSSNLCIAIWEFFLSLFSISSSPGNILFYFFTFYLTAGDSTWDCHKPCPCCKNILRTNPRGTKNRKQLHKYTCYLEMTVTSLKL